MFYRILLWIVVAYLCSHMVKVLLLLDLNKEMYLHLPGKCKLIPGVENGSEDIELLPGGLAIISSGLLYHNRAQRKENHGNLLLFDFNRQDPQNPKIETLIIESGASSQNFERKWLNPHGISSFISKGRISLYVISHPPSGGSTVEVFLFDKSKKIVRHVKTIRDPLITNANDLVVVGADKFFLTNDRYFENPILHQFEMYWMIHWGSLIFYDGTKGNLVASGLESPNGLAKSRDGKHLYCAMPPLEVIRIYKVATDMSVTFDKDIALLSSMDNLFTDPETGYLWAAGHPIVHETLKHLGNPHKYKSASQVLRIKFSEKEDHESWTVDQIFGDNGDTLSGSSVAVTHKSKLLIGTMFRQLMYCEITGVN